MLVELGVVEQRHAAVLEVFSGVAITLVAERYGVSRRPFPAAPRSIAAWCVTA